MSSRHLRPLLLTIVLAAACHRAGPPAATATLGDLQLDQGYAFEPITLASGAAYFRVTNHGTAEDTIVSVSSPAAAGAAFHGSNMGHLEVLPIPAGGTVELKPGGTHLMLTTYSAMPRAGESLTLVLQFAHAGTLNLKLPVRRYGE